ncbi:MAG: DUF6580 family putative transport protein [Verrucomicrobiota bacterium]
MKSKILWPVALILIFALSRWPGAMPQNFSAAYALFFCAGLCLPRRLAFFLPLGVMLLTDLLLTFCYYHTKDHTILAFARDQAGNYVSYAVLIWLGCALGAKKRSFATLWSGGILGAILFYLISNTGAWLGPGYGKTLAEWIRALTTGQPGYPPTWEFFRGTFLSGGIFTGLFVGAMKVSEAMDEAPVEKEEEEEEEEAEAEAGEAEPSLAPAAEDTGRPAPS